MPAPAERSAELHELKGVLTRFMRMLHPLEFRIDSLPDGRAALPFQYPLAAGEMVCLPERIELPGGEVTARGYYLTVAAHLAGRHEFGTFALRLAGLPGFAGRGETGAEALDCFIASFDDPALGGALVRLCESARIDARLCRRYRGLAPAVMRLNRALAQELDPGLLSAALIRAALGLAPAAEYAAGGFAARAAAFFAPLRGPDAGVLDSARVAGALYPWLLELMAAARRMGGAERMRDDLVNRALAGAGGAPSSGDGAIGERAGAEGAPDRDRALQASGRPGKGTSGRALSAVELRGLTKPDAEIRPSESSGGAAGEGMYLTRLLGGQGELEKLRGQLGEIGPAAAQGRRGMARRGADSYYAYDEWDCVLGGYRRNWCRLREMELPGGDGGFFAGTLERYAELLPAVRRHFQRIRPASYRMVRGLEDGEDLDLDRAIEMRVARLRGETPDNRVYQARKKESRDVATLFLLDMSASTDEPIPREARGPAGEDDDADGRMKAAQCRPRTARRPRRIIDVNKEALVIMAQAIEELGDSYAIMGFSGHGRDHVEFYVIKEFGQELSDRVKARIGAVEPKRSTRMGAAIRHVREKFRDVRARVKHAILLSDGFPQDFDYGHDRRSNAYGIQDTMVALKELELAGIMPFCLTVDKTGHDYLREMCPSSRYLVIEDLAALPLELPKIYERVVRW